MKLKRNCSAMKMTTNKPMTRRYNFSAITFALALIAICWSCNSNGCNDNRSSIPLAGFYSSDGKEISLNILEIGGIGAPNDSLILTAGTNVSQVYLPLRSKWDVVKYYIAYRSDGLNYPQLNDTITFRYNSIPFFASEECGAMMIYHVTSIDYTTHLLDSVAMVPADSVITNANVENLRIYFKTSTAEI